LASVLTPQSATAEALRDLQNSNPIRNSRMERQEAHRNYYYYYCCCCSYYYYNAPEKKGEKILHARAGKNDASGVWNQTGKTNYPQKTTRNSGPETET